jgi:peptidoglycan/xylan/chitin deacetylase (PgdA/CDA1 family)
LSFLNPVTCSLHHLVGEVTDFERGLNLSSTREAFKSHVEFFAANYNIIDLDTLLSGKLPERPLLITFDDTFESVFDAIREFLVPRKLPCVVFLNPLLLDGPDSISLDRAIAFAANVMGLQKLCEALGEPQHPDILSLVRKVRNGLSASKRQELRRRILTTLVDPSKSRGAHLVKPDDLKRFSDYRIEIGNHSATHVQCRSLENAEMHAELVLSREHLERLSGQKVRSFAVPYGSEDCLTPPILKTLRESGHKAIFLVHGRSNRIRPHSDVWYRVSLHNEPADILKRELNYLPTLRTIKHLVVGKQ